MLKLVFWPEFYNSILILANFKSMNSDFLFADASGLTVCLISSLGLGDFSWNSQHTTPIFWKCYISIAFMKFEHNCSLHWYHNDHDGVSNHQPHGCLLNRIFGRRSKKTSKLRVTGHCAGNSPGPVNSLHKGPVTRKMFPFDDVIMYRAV